MTGQFQLFSNISLKSQMKILCQGHAGCRHRIKIYLESQLLSKIKASSGASLKDIGIAFFPPSMVYFWNIYKWCLNFCMQWIALQHREVDTLGNHLYSMLVWIIWSEMQIEVITWRYIFKWKIHRIGIEVVRVWYSNTDFLW